MKPAVLTLCLLLALACGVRTTAAATGAHPDTLAALTDSSGGVPPAVLNARQAYQNAWSERQAGAYDDAVRITTGALNQVGAALATSPDQSTRSDLNDLQSRLTGLRDASTHDRDAAVAAAKSGNEADEKVLSTPAADEIQPQVNDQVLRWIDFFTGSGRSTFERWLKRSGRYMELFRAALQREGLPPDLVHLVFVESGFNLNARSVSAAVGPWQFLRGTAKLFGLTVDQWVDERRDPEKSTVAAARYLKHLYTMFGDWPLALASYNAGEGTVMRAIKAQGTTNYWDLRLPRQTEDYVPQFMAILAISRDPGKYGFDDVDLDEPMEFDEVALKGAVDLRALARMADCSYDELKLLNPAVLHQAANGTNGVTMIRVPRGKGEALMAKLQSGARLPAVDLTISHRVHRGETLNSIAADYHVSAKALALANGIGRRHPLRRGMTVTVPASISTPAIAQLEDGDPRASTSYVPARNIAPRALFQGKSEAEGRTVHTVHRGETLAGIADEYNVTIQDLRRWNRLKSDHVRRGTRLKVRTADLAAAAPAAPASAAANAATAVRAPADAGTPVSSTEAPIATVARATSTVTPIMSDADGAEADGPPAHAHGKVRAARKTATAPASRVITVKPGMTLGQLAQQHRTSITTLMRLNNLHSRQVRAGQKLRVPNS